MAAPWGTSAVRQGLSRPVRHQGCPPVLEGGLEASGLAYSQATSQLLPTKDKGPLCVTFLPTKAHLDV